METPLVIRRPTRRPAEVSVVAVGGCGLGIRFTVDRHPEPGENILADTLTTINGGKASNHAIGIQNLGGRGVLLSAVGQDHFAQAALEPARHRGVDLTGVVTKAGVPTMLGTIVVDSQGENSIIVAPGALGAFTADDVRDHADLIRSADACLVSLEIPTDAALAALTIARQAGVLTVLNPAPAPPRLRATELLRHSDVVTPNATEALALTGENDPFAAGESLRRAGANSVVLTRGADGAVVVDGDGTTAISAPQLSPDQVVDTSGAGDAFNVALTLALACGRSLVDATQLGCEAGARIVQGPGFVEALETWDSFKIA